MLIRSSFAIILLLLVFCRQVSAEITLTRGPYLQNGTPDAVTIRWRTVEPTDSFVFYGLDPENLHLVDGDLDLTTEHEIRLLGLSPNTKYFYAIGTILEDLASGPDFFFVTAPPVGTRKPTRIWAIGDCGTAATGLGDQIGVRDAYYAFNGNRYTDVWLALGDNAYYDGSDQNYQEAFFDIYPRKLRQSVLWSTLGNHETSLLRPDGGMAYLDIFTFPIRGEAGGILSGTELYYSFDYANIHFVCLDSQLSDRLPSGGMLAWLEADLTANTNEWLIAFFHHPPYTKGSHDSDEEISHIQMRENAIPLLESYGVDLVLGGHSHIYERSFLINGHYGDSLSLTPAMIKDSSKGRVSESGPYFKSIDGPDANRGSVYVVAGSSGWATYRTGHHPIMVVDELEMGSLVIDINGDRLDATFVRETGAIDDTFTIVKGSSEEPLRVSTFEVRNGSVIATWRSIPGKNYRVDRASRVNNPDWQPLEFLYADEVTTTWTRAIPGDQKEGFFRVVRLGD